jgi:PAS domain S-box-containing protein
MNEKRKDGFGRKVALYLGGLVLLVVLFITADEVFNIPSLIFDIPPTPINWAEAGIESFVVIVAGFFVMLHLRRQWAKGKQAEEALRQSQERYRTILEQIQDSYFEMDLAGNVTFFNNTMCRDLGYSRQELPRLNYQAYIAAEDVETVFRAFNETYRTGRTGRTPTFKFVRKDGSTGFGETWVSPLSNEAGEIIGFRGLSRDITERKQAEEALLQSEGRYRTILEEMQDGYFEADLAGNHTFVNDAFCRILGYSREEMMGRNYRVYVAEEDSKAIREAYNHAYRTGEPLIGFVHRVIRKDGAPGLVEFSAFVVRNKAGEIIGFRGVGRDVTELKRAEQHLLTTSKLASVGELASGLAHELNNPLTGIIGYAQLLTSRGNVPQDVKRDLNRIHQESQRAAKIVQNLLSFARQRKPNKGYFDVNELIQKTLELRNYELRTSNIGIYVNLAPGLPGVIGDYHQIQQVVLNMLINAEQAILEAKHRGKITITTSTVESHVEISIADNGPGIANEDIGKVFDPFFTTKEVGSGTGLGLSVCHGIVTEHGGKICVESRKGKGATFTIELPLTTQGEAVFEEEHRPLVKKSQPRKFETTGRILVVDDEPAVCDVLARALCEEGYVTDSALSTRAALQKIARNNYELYIIDLKMPRTSGKRLYQIMKQRYPSSAEKVVFITGDAITRATQNFLASAGKPYLAKPFEAKQIIELVEETVGGGQ